MRTLAALSVLFLPPAVVFIAAYLLTLPPPPAAHRPTLPGGVVAALQQADRIELLSLDPRRVAGDGDSFHGWRVLGRTEVEAKSAGPVVADVLRLGAEEGGAGYLCFDPRHGIRAFGPDGVVELVLCFECGYAEVYGVSWVKGFGVGPTPQATFDRLLREGGVPLATKPGGRP
jgi:hypothetical protein